VTIRILVPINQIIKLSNRPKVSYWTIYSYKVKYGRTGTIIGFLCGCMQDGELVGKNNHYNHSKLPRFAVMQDRSKTWLYLGKSAIYR